ncbi:hypothetical protein SAMN05216174_11480 [Actinokineospora iranica]|uniref:Uncharacterized protein n=1 Tax=Actinokineospora iranica TaxID=1271860 RepID=A0A1G6WBX3_9PSEU|nr:hypothetical protein SAMN05216174_11480 [Actinokineospora iranica]
MSALTQDHPNAGLELLAATMIVPISADGAELTQEELAGLVGKTRSLC